MKYLPYKRIESIELVNENSNVLIVKDEDLHFIPDIISQLLNTASPLWDKLKTRPSMSVAEELANTLLKIGEKYKSNIIISLSNEINLNVSNFDLEKLMISIKKYPDLLLQYKELLKK